MGGLMALHTTRAAPEGFFQGLILSAPALVGDPATDTPLNRFLARVLSNTFPKLEVAKLPLTHLCTDEHVVAQYKQDPLVFHGALRARVGAELIRAMPLASALSGELSTPLLLVHGEEDKLVDIKGSHSLLRTYGHKDKELKTFPGLMHELHNERGALGEGGSVHYITTWVEKRM